VSRNGKKSLGNAKLERAVETPISPGEVVMSYIDFEKLEAIDGRAFRTNQPYPWANPAGLLTDAGHRALLETLPAALQFQEVVGKARKFGQRSHDRLSLEYQPDLELAPPWRDFLAELRGARYSETLCGLFGRRALDLRFHWHYTGRGCSVSPHCDSMHKLGSHIFYLNSEKDWDLSWGGETLILEAERYPNRRSAPEIEDFDRVIESDHLGNRSLLFMRRGDSWHAVREIQCPEGQFRKVFIVVINRVGPVETLRRIATGRHEGSA
jgi:hypothetical protein